MVRITYFPQKTEKKDTKYIPNITYQYSDTRPTKNQLSPYQTKEFRLLPITPMPPILKLLSYLPKRSNHNHSIFPCPNYSCIMCRQYETIPNINANINVPIIPCLRYRSTYICTNGMKKKSNTHTLRQQTCKRQTYATSGIQPK